MQDYETKILSPTLENIRICSDELKNGGIVAFPTETVYGLGGNAMQDSAAKKIYEAKGRPSDNPLIVHFYSISQIENIAQEVSPLAEKLAKMFMPGPLTLVFKKKDVIPDTVTGKMGTVAIRIPSNPIARSLLRECNLPICAPSANTSTRPSPTTAMHVFNDLHGKLRYILDGGSCDIGVESTILDVSSSVPRLLRLGGTPIEKIEEITGKLEIVQNSAVALCPGMKYKHYAPKADVFFSAFYEGMDKTICAKYDELSALGKNPVIMCMNENAEKYGARNILRVGKTYDDYARALFFDLREADDMKYDSIIAEGVGDDGMGRAIINRLVKSSGGQII